MNIYVIVVTYNGAHWVEKCFGSLIASTVPLNIFVIDNASSDGTPDKIKALFPQIALIEIDTNLGFGKANNIGLINALENNADYVFLLNQDAWVEPDTIEKLIAVSQLNLEFGIISPLHMNGQGTGLDYNFSQYISPGGCPALVSDIIVQDVKTIYETSYVNAAAWLLTNKCLTKIGGFDPIFPHYGEDSDYLNRTLYLGLKVGIVPDAKIYHDRICKSSAELAKNQKLLVISNLLELKTYPNSFRFNCVMFFKKQVEELASLLIMRDFSRFNVKLGALIKTIFMLNRLIKSKKFFAEEGSDILLS